MRVLLIDDNVELSSSLADFLEEYNYELDFAYTGASGLELLAENEYDIIILDVTMPGLDGYQTCDIIRNSMQISTPIIFLTARDTIEDKISGYEAGADDYLIKPFLPIELHYRLQALTKRGQRKDVGKQHIGELLIDYSQSCVIRQDKAIALNTTQMELIKVLAQHAPEPVSREKLERLLWREDMPDSEPLRTHIYRLRLLIDKPFENQIIESVYGKGYRLVCH